MCVCVYVCVCVSMCVFLCVSISESLVIFLVVVRFFVQLSEVCFFVLLAQLIFLYFSSIFIVCSSSLSLGRCLALFCDIFIIILLHFFLVVARSTFRNYFLCIRFLQLMRNISSSLVWLKLDEWICFEKVVAVALCCVSSSLCWLSLHYCHWISLPLIARSWGTILC